MNKKFEINFEPEPEDRKRVDELMELIIRDAHSKKASDIHLNPYREGFKIRYRIDGVMKDIKVLNPKLYKPLIKSIKDMSSLDCNSDNKPQAGKMEFEFQDHYLDVRVSTLPSYFGENVVMRILDKSSVTLDLSRMGFSEEMLKDYKELLHRPYGLLIITGPTGSGKNYQRLCHPERIKHYRF